MAVGCEHILAIDRPSDVASSGGHLLYRKSTPCFAKCKRICLQPFGCGHNRDAESQSRVARAACAESHRAAFAEPRFGPVSMRFAACFVAVCARLEYMEKPNLGPHSSAQKGNHDPRGRNVRYLLRPPQQTRVFHGSRHGRSRQALHGRGAHHLAELAAPASEVIAAGERL